MQGIVSERLHVVQHLPTAAPQPAEGESTFSAGRTVEKDFPIFFMPEDEE
jgi:hypothetical protein